MSSNMILDALVQRLIFHDGASNHFGFGPLAENARTFERNLGAKSVINGPQKSNQSTTLPRVIMELRF